MESQFPGECILERFDEKLEFSHHRRELRALRQHAWPEGLEEMVELAPAHYALGSAESGPTLAVNGWFANASQFVSDACFGVDL